MPGVYVPTTARMLGILDTFVSTIISRLNNNAGVTPGTALLNRV